MIDIEVSTTPRGFALGRFEDSKGVACSIQESSIASYAAIWLGCEEIGLKRFEPGKGWRDVALEQDSPHGVAHIANTRMHLDQDQAAALIPLLQHFVEHGILTPPADSGGSEAGG